jgi:hypothetical protein
MYSQASRSKYNTHCQPRSQVLDCYIQIGLHSNLVRLISHTGLKNLNFRHPDNHHRLKSRFRHYLYDSE